MTAAEAMAEKGIQVLLLESESWAEVVIHWALIADHDAAKPAVDPTGFVAMRFYQISSFARQIDAT